MARWVDKWTVRGNSGVGHTVSVSDNGEWGCSCPAWKFKKRDAKARGEMCHHIMQKKAEINWIDGDMGAVMRLKAQLIERYKEQGKSEEWIVGKLAVT